MCVNAPANHATKYPDLERVGPGRYRIHASLCDRATSSDEEVGNSFSAPAKAHSPIKRRASDPVALDLELVPRLLSLLTREPLTSRIAAVEHDLVGRDPGSLADVAGLAELSVQTAQAAIQVRSALGRLSDVIHASVICSVIPRIMRDEERITVRPSLAAGNDASRPYDLETTHRIAEFKVAIWQGRDTMRKRMLVADYVSLAMDQRPLDKELYVVGPRPAQFLRSSRATIQWALQRSAQGLRDRFEARYGPAPVPIKDFASGPGADVRVIDLHHLLPEMVATQA